MDLIDYLFTGTVLVGVIANISALAVSRYNRDDISWLKMRSVAILLLSSGFIIHTLGDFLGRFYGESMEIGLESVAHVIIFCGFIAFFYASKKILTFSEEYGYK